MAWYYRDGDLELGPVGKADLQQLIKDKKIGAKTMVRDADSQQWRPLADLVRGQHKASQQAPPPDAGASAGSEAIPEQPSATASGGGEADSAAATAVCSQCGRSFPQDQVLTYDDKTICAACKPMFVQKLKEGASLPTHFEYGGFWIRFVAKFIDGLILAVAQWAVMIPLGLMMGGAMMESAEQYPPPGLFAVMGIQMLISILIPAAYNTFFIGRYSATLGKMACRLEVVTPEGGKVSYARALGRYFSEIISSIVLLIGYIMAAFDEEKRALHDRICSTRVVRKG